MNQSNQRCENCRFWLLFKKEGGPDTGLCRKLPPAPRPTDWPPTARQFKFQWPQTMSHEWCGAWEEREADDD